MNHFLKAIDRKPNMIVGFFVKSLMLLTIAVCFFTLQSGAQVSLTASSGVPAAGYTTLKEAFDAINTGIHHGDIIISISSSTNEGTTPATLNSNDADPSSYSSVLIQPTDDNIVIAGNPASGFGVIQLNGADNVTINGDNPNSGGTNRNLTISNTTTATFTGNSCIRIATSAAVKSADNISILNCILSGHVTAGNSNAITASSSSSNISFGIYAGGNGGATATGAPTAITSETANSAPVGTTMFSFTVTNNAISNCGRAIVYNNASSAGSNNVSVSQNEIGTSASLGAYPYTSPSGTVYVSGIWLSGANNVSISGNTINNLMSYVQTARTGIDLFSNISGTLSVSDNTITGVVSNSAGAYPALGISVSSAGGVYSVSGNSISIIENSSSAIGAPASGIRINTASGPGTISRNEISAVMNRNAGPSPAQGIYLATASNGTIIRNNFISNIMNVGLGSFNFTGNANGILISSGSSHKVYHNSINQYGTSLATGTNSINCLSISSNILQGIDIRNNVFSNTVTGGAASNVHACLFFPFGISASMGLTLNNNAYYTGNTAGLSGIAFAGSVFYAAASLYSVGNFNPQVTAGATNWRNFSSGLGVGTNDFGSFGSTAAAPFVSATNLHIPAATITQLESGGAAVGVTNDIDADVRSVSFPDIGADEFNGTVTDLTAPAISYSPFTNTCALGDRLLQVTIADISGVPVAGAGLPVLYWFINGVPQPAVTATHISGTLYEFVFGAAALLGDIVTYYVVAQDNLGNVIAQPTFGAAGYTVNPPAVTTAPSTPSSYTIQPALLTGTYDVGVSGAYDYPTITAAINAYNNSCPTGPVVFRLMDINYPAETYPIVISNPEANAVNTLTIIPNTGVGVTVSGNHASALFMLRGADYVTFNGLNTGGSSLSITNTNALSTATVFWLASNGADAATHNSILNCTISGSGTSTSFGCITSGSSASIGTSASAANSNNTVSNCTLKAAQHGIFINGYTGTYDQNWVISNNIIGSVSAPEKIGVRGIAIQGVNNFGITGNTISGLSMNAAATAVGIYVVGYAANGTITANYINDIRQNNIGGGSCGIYLGTGLNTSFVTVANNFIYDIYALGSSVLTNNACGIVVNSGGGYSILFNSVSITAGAGASNSISAAIRISSAVTFTGALDIRNNIFSNTTAIGIRYSIYNGSVASIFSSINYNNYYTGSSPILGYLEGNKANFPAWQSVSGGDQKSMSADPLFISATDLHLQPASPMNSMGITVAGLATDIDADTRLATPDIGADEFDAQNCAGSPAGGTITASTLALCFSGSASLSATGYATGDGITYQWEYSTNGFVTPQNLAGQTVPTNANTGLLLVTTSFRLKVSCTNGGSVAYSNVIIIAVNSPVITSATGATRCGRGTVNLTATSTTPGATFNWFTTATGGTSIGTGSPFTTPIITASTNFYVAATVGTTTGSVGPLTPSSQGGSIGTQNINWDVFFDVLESTTLLSVDIFPNTSGQVSSLLIRNSSGTLLATIPYTTTVSGGLMAQTIPINLALTPGTGYYISGAMPAGGLQRNTDGAAYPYSSSAIKITGNGFLNSYYMGFYNFQYSVACASPRTMVTATVTPAPAITTPVANPSIICVGGTSLLSVSSGNAGYSYMWNPGSLAGTLVGVNPVTTTTYTVTATDVSGGPFNGCSTVGTVNVSVRQLPTAVTVTPSTATVCIGGTATLLNATGGVLSNITAISENFNGLTNSWLTYNNSVGNTPEDAAWTLRPNGYFYNFSFNSNDASQFYMSNSNAQGSGGLTNTLLQSPVINLSGYTTANLSFWHYFRYSTGASAIVEASTDGVTWAAIPGGTYTSTQGAPSGFVNANLNMNAYAGQPIVYIRFNYQDAAYGWYWAIDNILLNGNVNTIMTWTQAPAAPNSIFTDAGASIPYISGSDANSVYVQPAVTTTYTAVATWPPPITCSSTGTSTITVIPPVSVSITVSDNPICPSASVTFTATPVNGGPSPTYQWQVNGANVGANSPTFTYFPSDLDQVKVIMVGNGSCTAGNPATSNTITMSVTGPIAVGVNISANPGNFVCAGTLVTFTATPINGGPAPTYQWKKNGINVGTNSPTYSYAFAYAENGDAITCSIVSNSECISGSPTAVSPQILMTVNDIGPCSVVIGIFANTTTVCANTQVTVRATPTRPGLAPTYEFFLNNISQGIQTSNDFVFTPVNGDKVRVRLTSNYTCLVGTNIRNSNTLTMTVLQNLPASVTMTNTPTLCSGTPITFTATPTNGGVNPTYNFLLNGISTQNTTSNTFTVLSPVNGNTVQVIMTSDYLCATGNPASSSIYTIALNASPVVSAATDCNALLPGSGQVANLTATAVAGSGSITNYQWVLNGVTNVGTNSAAYTTNIAGSYTVTVTNSNGCNTTSAVPIVITNTGAPLAAGTYIIPGTGCGNFDKISSAIDYINTWGVGGAVIFGITPGYTETAPPGGYDITATGTLTNTITFQRNGAGANPVITAGLQVAGSNKDAVIKVTGGDYITFRNLTLQENPGNTVLATGPTNTMTEWGIALQYASNTNGPSNNTIENNVISLNRLYPNSFGIYSNMRHSPANPAVLADISNLSSGQHKVYANAISNVNTPVLFLGAPANLSPANDIGGTSALTGNTLTNWGSNTAPGGNAIFAGTTASISGISAMNQSGLNIGWNNISNTAGINPGVAGLRGIFIDFTGAVSGTFTNSVNNNSVSLNSSAASGILEAISSANTAASGAVAGITIDISNNSVSAVLTGAGSNITVTGIRNEFPCGMLAITGNVTKGNTSSATTGGYTGIVNNAAVVTTVNISNNQFGDATTDAINFSAAVSGDVMAISNTGAASSATLTISNNAFTRFVHSIAATATYNFINSTASPASQQVLSNNFSGITLNSSGNITGINSPALSVNKQINGNLFASISSGAGALTLIKTAGGTTMADVNNNNIGNNTANSITATGNITGIELTNVATGIATVSANTVTGLSATGTAATTVSGIITASPVCSISSNIISKLASSGNNAFIQGVNVTSGTTVNVNQNTITTLTGTGTGNVSATGMRCSGGAVVNISANRIYDISQQSAVTGTAALVNGILMQDGTTVTVSNNFVSDLKTPLANMSEAIRGIAVTSSTASSVYNIFYNSIYLAATSTGANFGSSGLSFAGNPVATTASLNLRNNIIDNESVANGTGQTVSLRNSSTSLANLSPSSNNNLYFSGSLAVPGLLYFDGTNSEVNVTGLQARLAPAENASISAQPFFVSITDLHMNPGINCGIDGAASPIPGFTTDIDTDTRDVVTPDIGADEFTGTGGGAGVWKGINTNWNDPLNWCGQVPNAGTNVTIPAAVANYPLITNATPVARNITIAGGGTVTITGAGKLAIYGTISNAGTFNVADGTIEMAGNTAQTIPAGAFQNNDLKNLVINNAFVELGGTLNLHGKLSFTGNNRTLATEDNLVLRSTATGTASVRDITNNGTVTGNTITGDVTVERFITARRAWRFLSVPTQNNLQTIKEAWQENMPANSNTQTTPPGYGIHITKDSANWAAYGFDLQTTPGPSMKTFVPATNTWKGITSTVDVPGVNNGRFVTGTGYMTLVRGDRTVNTFPSAATVTTLREKGALVTGTFGPVAVGAGQFAAIGNPYASAINFTKLTRSNLDDVYYLWDPYLGSLGGYVTFTGPTYTPTPSLSYTANKFIESGQAFFVRSNGPAGTLTITEPAKEDGSYLVTRPTGPVSQLRTNLYLVDTAGRHLYDGVLSEFDELYSNGIDGLDAEKMVNFGENLGIKAGDKVLSVERHARLKETDTIHYNLGQVRVRNYQLEFVAEGLDQSGLAAFLEDRYLDTKTPVSLTGTTVVDFNVINEPGSYAPDRFRLVFRQSAPVPVTFTSIRANKHDRSSILVEWKVENELNIHHYELERSGDGRTFSKVNEQVARGNGSGLPLVYNWLDVNPLEGDNFYRVRSVGIGSDSKLSQVVKVNMGKLPSEIAVYPNPVQEDGVVNISLQNKAAGDYQVSLVNSKGQVVLKQVLNHGGGSSVYSIRMEKYISHGNYMLHIESAGNKLNIFKIVY